MVLRLEGVEPRSGNALDAIFCAQDTTDHGSIGIRISAKIDCLFDSVFVGGEPGKDRKANADGLFCGEASFQKLM